MIKNNNFLNMRKRNRLFNGIIAKAERNMKGESEEKINKYVYNCINRESKSIEELCYSACAFKLLTNAKYNRIVTGDEELAQLLYVKAAHYATDNDSCSFILDSILHAYFDEKVPFFKRIFFFMKQYNKLMKFPLTNKDAERSNRIFSLPFQNKEVEEGPF